MSNSTVYLMDTLGNILDSTNTNNAGHYNFKQVPPGDYLLTASTNLAAGGVDLCDAFLIILEIFNLYNFNEIQGFSADVDGNGVVNWADYGAIVSGWFTYGYPFPVGEWVFETIAVSSGSRDGGNGGFTSSSTGDVGGTYEPDKDVYMSSINYIPRLEKVNAGIINYDVILNSQAAIDGFHIRFALPEGTTYTGISTDLDIKINPGKEIIRMTWLDEEQNKDLDQITFTIQLSIENYADHARPIVLQPGYGSHFINERGEIASDIRIILEEVTILPSNNNLSFQEVSMGPNPFMNTTTLRYYAAEAGNVDLMISNSGGKVLKSISWYADEGQQERRLDFEDLPAGIYFYTVNFREQGNINKGSMIKIR